MTFQRRTVAVLVVLVAALGMATTADALDPMFGAVDPDALDALCRGGERSQVAFRYADIRVAVWTDGVVQVRAR